MSGTTAQPVELFISYSHVDQEMRNELIQHLSVLIRQGVISAWHDRKIFPGTEWGKEIDPRINSADVILLLVSPGFLDSDYCYDIEMKRALERHEAGESRVIPIILRSVDWHGAPFGKLQSLPKDGRPVTSWADRDEAFANIASGIRQAVEKFRAVPKDDAPIQPPPPIWNIPYQRNPHFINREDLFVELRKALTDKHAAAYAITGLAGMGKTALAVEYAYRHAADYRIVWWVKAEDLVTLATAYAELARALRLPEHTATDHRMIVQAVRHWLGTNTGWLLIFDGVRQAADLYNYLPPIQTGHVLITSRDPNWHGVATPLAVDTFTLEDAVDFLLRRTGQTDATAAAALAEELGHLPLALNIAGANIEATGSTLARYLELFRLTAGQVRSLLSEHGLMAAQQFLEKAGAAVRRRGDRGFEIISAPLGKLTPFVPLPVLLASDSSDDEDVAELARSFQPSSGNQRWVAGILFYNQPPDALALNRMAEAQLRNRFITIPIPLAAADKALTTNADCRSLLAEFAERYLPGANLFDDRIAISDTATFFGRTELLHRLEEDLLKYQGIGLFGLRKSGKTSVLLQLALILRQHPVVHLDLQWYGGKLRFGAELFNEIIQRLSALLDARIPESAPRFEPFARDAAAADVAPEFARRVRVLDEKLQESGYKPPMICLLDEVERILPSPEDSREKVEEFNAFFGTLRALCQQQRRLSLLVTDVHPDCNRINQWTQTGVPTNPVFKFFKEIFLTPFTPEDTSTMLISIGRLMGCKQAFDAETLAQIYQASGGHPFIARQLASLLSQKARLKEHQTISWAAAQRYLDKALTYSSTLKDYIGAGIWGDLEKRQFRSAMVVLEALACRKDADEWATETILRKQIGNQFTENQLLDALQWLEAVGLIEREEATDFDRYRIHLPLLSHWLRMNLSIEEVRQWQIA